MRSPAGRLILLLLVLATRAQAAAITVTAADQDRLGITSSQLAEARVQQSTPAYVRVLDPAALAALDADLTAARAASTASTKNAKRLQRLAAEDESASQQAAEAAAAQAVADAAHTSALARRLAVDWAPALEAMSRRDRAELVRQLAARDAVLLRADTPEALDGTQAVLSVGSDSDVARVAETLGPAGAVDPRMQTFGLLAVLRGGTLDALPPGRVLEGRVSHGAEQSGVVIPRSAIVRLEGADWAYVRTGPESFERRQIAAPTPTTAGWFVATGFASGDDVVVDGAGAVLAIEREDESGEVD